MNNKICRFLVLLLLHSSVVDKATANSLAVRDKKDDLPKLPAYGPRPWDVKIVVPSRVKDVGVPYIQPGCKRTAPPYAQDFKVSHYIQRYGHAKIGFVFGWCLEKQMLRIRLFSYKQSRKPDGSIARTATLLKAYQTTEAQQKDFIIWKVGCRPKHIYVEACATKKGWKRPLCGTTKIASLFAYPVIAPLVTRHPPPVLKLGPGDRPKIEYIVAPGKQAFGEGSAIYRLQIAVRAKNGKWLGATDWVTGMKVSLRLPLGEKPWKGVQPELYDGATVFLRFAYAWCSVNIATLRMNGETKLQVNKDIPQLVLQDSKLPRLGKVFYPKTVFGKPVTLKIHAKNVGDGLRANRKRTQLSYQWYLRMYSFKNRPSYPKTLKGNTWPVLKVKRAECQVASCDGEGSCFGLREYFVVVCNTLGCVRSNVVTPKIAPPPLKKGQTWNKEFCGIVHQ